MGCTRAVASLRALVVLVVVLVAACSSQAPAPPPPLESVGATRQAVISILPLFPTGTSALGAQVATGLVDLHYGITASTDGARPAPRSAFTSTPDGGWASPGTTS